MKRLFAGVFLLGFLSVLTGCTLKNGVDLMQLPKPNKDRQAITDELARVKPSDAVEDAPYQGENRNTVQMVDLDGDGTEEVVAFFRTPANGNTYEAVVLTKESDERYRYVGSVRGIGSRIDSVDYPVITPEGQRAILFSMEQMGEQSNHLIAADYMGESVRVMLETDYVDMMSIDSDGNGTKEIFLISGQDTRHIASIYSYDVNSRGLKMMSESPLSASAKIIERMHKGYIADHIPAVFVEETVQGSNGQQTDIFVWRRESGLRNLARNTESGTGKGTYRVVPANAYDINGDGLTEIPRAVKMVGSVGEEGNEVYMLDWYLYAENRQPMYVQTTYRNVSQEWDFVMSSEWRDRVRAVKGTEDGIDYTTFEAYAPDGKSVPLLTIYYLLGTADDVKQEIEEKQLFALDTVTSGIFAAEIPQEAANSSLALTEAQVKERFAPITVHWNEIES
ncbi:MAG: hypothetical protein KHY89_06955 [Butyricicoccus pullicaecorum]|nr:hypothetical protein [Butyricicoccus pullicaecorum]